MEKTTDFKLRVFLVVLFVLFMGVMFCVWFVYPTFGYAEDSKTPPDFGWWFPPGDLRSQGCPGGLYYYAWGTPENHTEKWYCVLDSGYGFRNNPIPKLDSTRVWQYKRILIDRPGEYVEWDLRDDMSASHGICHPVLEGTGKNGDPLCKPTSTQYLINTICQKYQTDEWALVDFWIERNAADRHHPKAELWFRRHVACPKEEK